MIFFPMVHPARDGSSDGKPAELLRSVAEKSKPALQPHQIEGENSMSYQLISRHEIEDLCEKALKAKWSALMFDLVRTPTERTLTLASVEIVSAEMHRKQGKIPKMMQDCWL
jgi:hypothetical protein